MRKRRFFWILGIFMILVLVAGVSAERLSIDIGNSYSPGENINFKVTIFDDSNNKLDERIEVMIQDYYTEVVYEGDVNSGEGVSFKLPEDAEGGYWAVTAKYKNIEKKELFSVSEAEKIEVNLEGDKLIISNIGNVPYSKSIQIAIGSHIESVYIPLDKGEIKRIRLTAPAGEYDVRISDGTEENTHQFSGVVLTGNVIGLESVLEGNFWQRNPVIPLFLITIGATIVIIFTSRIGRKKAAI
jgi:hypothetical protein